MSHFRRGAHALSSSSQAHIPSYPSILVDQSSAKVEADYKRIHEQLQRVIYTEISFISIH
jgi:hypothetical protein